MFLATLFISGRDWLLPAAAALGGALLLLFWGYRRAPATGVVRAACFGLKLVGILALAACLLEPLWSGQRARPGANFFAIVADNSQGMTIKDRGQSRSRGELLRATLIRSDGWQNQLDENFQVRRYVFDSRLQSTKDFSELLFDGRASSIGAALRAIAERYQSQPLAGVLLMTDGNATDIPDGVPDLAGLPPVYPVVSGTDQPIKDIAINNVNVSQTSFEDAPVSIQADVMAVGYAGEKVVAQLFEIPAPSRGTTNRLADNRAAATSLSGKSAARPAISNAVSAASAPGAAVLPEKMVAEQSLKAPREGETMPFRFQIRPAKSGVVFYRLRVSASGELGQFARPETSSEATLANNIRVLSVDRGQGPYRVLYVGGRPNWEYKFLSRAVAEDDQIELAGLIRVAKREPKFGFRGRRGETSNPLFRGFDDPLKEEVERYDQPVTVRLNTRDEFELRGGFPKTAEELYAYYAVVLDDVEAEFFSPDQMALLHKFVAERGGGFLMLGGAESFHQGKFEHTPIGDMLPVYLDQVPQTQPPGELRLSLTREGWLQPWARLRNNEADEQSRLGGMPPFLVMNQVRGIKPGASVIATVTDGRATNMPALVVQRFGNGRAAALTLGDFWHWGLRDAEAHRDLDKAWRQMIRWLVADVPNRIDIQAAPKRGDPNQAMLLQVRGRDKSFQPLDNATVTVNVRFVGQEAAAALTNAPAMPASTAAATNSIRITAEPALSEAGLYQATYVPRETGGYLAEAIVTDAAGVEVGRDEVGWTSNPSAEEFRSLKPNRALLETIAKRTGGEIIAVNKLDEFAASLPHRNVPITEAWTTPFWHQPAVFLFALLCFVAEWGVRRWKGLA